MMFTRVIGRFLIGIISYVSTIFKNKPKKIKKKTATFCILKNICVPSTCL